MKKENPDFMYEVQVDENDQACNLFWKDAKARIDYEFFGNVVCFDTTFMTNRYGMPCAQFVGVNYHGMSMLFGMALLVDETTESFVWAFQSFLSAMSEKHPKNIFSDQAQAISNAIEQVMPDTHHRLCLWHIYQNATKHLSHVYAANTDFEKDFQSCMYNAETEEEFETLWVSMITKYSLSENEWLTNLYSLRNGLLCMEANFCAGMTSTQRSESVYSFVKGYVNSSLRINVFITQYEKATMNWREKELQADYRCKQITKHILVSAVSFERQAFKVR
ncbi:protein FAR1-RELATED SEQUENCE 5-like [Papaver somniferum]|uniref:protein FAR1-RELATED SEQUENCE 5-like n=1 Tax=Papaver somniferum TaxID=3469 RepID=UPI000E6FD1F6|nr:protein FAR1-RELATED SEQUENCE 5-like [Papaver somniferum]